MPNNTIGDFVLKYALDPKGVQSGAKKVTESISSIDKSAATSQKSLQGLSSSATKIFAALGGAVALKSFIQNTAAVSEELSRLSKSTGQDISTMAAWRNAASETGGSASALTQTLRALSREQTAIQLTGESSILPFFAQLGVALHEVDGTARDFEKIFLDLNSVLQNVSKPKAYSLLSGMGIDEGTAHLILTNRKELEALISKQKQNTVLNKGFTDQVSKLSTAWRAGKIELENFATGVFAQAIPALQKLMDWFGKLGEWVSENRDFVITFLKVFSGGLILLAASAIPISATAAIITALAAAIALLTDDYNTWKRGEKSLIDWSAWESGIAFAKQGLQGISNLLKDLIYRAIAFGDAIRSLGTGDLKGFARASQEMLSGAPTKTEPPKSFGGTSSSSKEKRALDYFRAQGWEPHQAAGIVANLKRESSTFNESAIGDSGKAFGIAQWHPDRQAEFSRVFGKSIRGSSFEDQLAFIQHELTAGKEKSAGSKLRGAQSAAEAASLVSRYYERPSDVEGEAKKRAMIASELYAGISNASQFATIPTEARAAQSIQNSIENNIGEIKIYTNATEVASIAGEIAQQIDFTLTQQANVGLR